MQMSQFNLDYPSPPPPPPPQGPKSDNSRGFNMAFKSEKQDEHASPGSEDGSYSLYGEGHKSETDLEEESNSALTSQTLNPDGTPKRPMNAFMIFARRRRPQVSADNQNLRTGEISKILSKEWTSMASHDKQFYLDQAKQLKDTFNTRYPDYVYRRRPNNSRKRRRIDSVSSKSVDNTLTPEGAEDFAGNPELGETSPIDVEDGISDLASQYSRPTSDISRSYVGDGGKYATSRTPSYSYSADAVFRSSGTQDRRLPFPSTNDHLNRPLPSIASLSSPRLSHSNTNPLQFSYLPTQINPQTPPLYTSDSVNVSDAWPPRIDRTPTGWPGNNPERGLGGQKTSSYPPSGSHSSWPNSTPGMPGHGLPSPPFDYSLPTLTAPFAPSTAQVQGYPTNSTPSTSSQNGSSPRYPASNHMPPTSLASRDFDERDYASSPSVSPVNSYPSNATRDPLSYFQRQPSLSSRGLPPVQSISGYSQSQSLQSSTSSPGVNPPQGYWSREKMDNF